MARLTIRIDLRETEAIGPGKVRLLEKIAECGSIRGAAAAMDMSYRRAWLLVQELKKIMGAPVISAATGGSKGGGANLTKLGSRVVKHYRAIERRAHRSATREIDALERLVKRKKQRGS